MFYESLFSIYHACDCIILVIADCHDDVTCEMPCIFDFRFEAKGASGGSVFRISEGPTNSHHHHEKRENKNKQNVSSHGSKRRTKHMPHEEKLQFRFNFHPPNVDGLLAASNQNQKHPAPKRLSHSRTLLLFFVSR
jgi:hypothetical protein